MGKSKAAVSIDAALLKAATARAARTGRKPEEIIEKALRLYIGGPSEVLRKLRSENPDDLADEEAQRIAYEELDAFRASQE